MSLLSLKVESPGKEPVIKKVPEKGLTLGRDPGNGIAVPDDTTLSGTHFRIDVTDQGMMVRDLKSSNGTRVNKKNIGHLPYRLKAGDVVQAGNTRITVIQEAEKETRSGVGEMLSGMGKKLREVTGQLFGGGKGGPKAPPGFAVCPNCGTKIHVGVKAKGSRVGCPRCKNVFLL